MQNNNSSNNEYQNINNFYDPNAEPPFINNQNGFIIESDFSPKNHNKSNSPNNKEKEKQNALTLIKNSVVIEPISRISLLGVFKDIGATLYYGFNTNPIFNEAQAAIPVVIFNHLIYNKFKLKSILISLYNTIFQMTYRSSFPDLLKKNYFTEDVITSDNGWGCMIRSCQMMLSKGIIERKIYKYKKENNVDEMYYMNLLQIRKETLFLFYDNYVSMEKTLGHPDYQNFYKQFETIAKQEQKYQNIIGVFPPYSIQTICDVMGCVGTWTSDIKVIKTILEINKLFFNNEDSYLYFCDGNISEKKLLSAFCKEEPMIVSSDSEIKYKQFESFPESNYYIYKGKTYSFLKGGIIFISLRLGLSTVTEEYLGSVINLFSKIRNNIGFVGGRNGKAYYFIGVTDLPDLPEMSDISLVLKGKLLYLDPHLNQKAVDPETDEGQTYIVKYVYQLDPKELSSQFTFGVVINNQVDLTNFISDIRGLKASKYNYDFLNIID